MCSFVSFLLACVLLLSSKKKVNKTEYNTQQPTNQINQRGKWGPPVLNCHFYMFSVNPSPPSTSSFRFYLLSPIFFSSFCERPLVIFSNRTPTPSIIVINARPLSYTDTFLNNEGFMPTILTVVNLHDYVIYMKLTVIINNIKV